MYSTNQILPAVMTQKTILELMVIQNFLTLYLIFTTRLGTFDHLICYLNHHYLIKEISNQLGIKNKVGVT